MKATAFVCAALLGLGGGAFAADLQTIDGQVSITAKEGNKIKSGPVQVSLFDLKTLSDAMEAKKKAALPVGEYFTPQLKIAVQEEKLAEEAELKANDGDEAAYDSGDRARIKAVEEVGDKAVEATDKANAKIALHTGFAHYPVSNLYFFDSLPASLQTAKSDADGKFSFQVPNGSYVLVAMYSRDAGKRMIVDRQYPVTEFYYWMVKVKVDGKAARAILGNDNITTAGSADSLVAAVDDDFLVAHAMKDHNLPWLLDYITAWKKAAEAKAAAPP